MADGDHEAVGGGHDRRPQRGREVDARMEVLVRAEGRLEEDVGWTESLGDREMRHRPGEREPRDRLPDRKLAVDHREADPDLSFGPRVLVRAQDQVLLLGLEELRQRGGYLRRLIRQVLLSGLDLSDQARQLVANVALSA